MTVHPSFEICGADVSKWQSFVDYDKFIAAGLRFVIARSSIGAWADSVYPRHVAGAIEHGLPHGAYHFWQPGSTSAQNATAMIKAVRCCVPMGCWLDLEAAAGNLTIRQTTLHILATLERLDDYYGTPTGLYSNKSSWQRLIDPSMYHDFKLDERPLWVANYLVKFGTKPLMPSGWPTWLLWQFSAETGPYAQKAAQFGIVGSKSLDIDAFNGDEIDFLEFSGHEPIEIPEPPITPPQPPAPPVIAPAKLTGFRVAHDLEKGKPWRVKKGKEPVPEIFWLKDETIPLTKALQELIYEMNQPGMTKKQFRTFLGKRTAFANSAGFDDNDPRADFINRENLDKPLPRLGKVYTFGGANLHGKIDGDYLVVETIDGKNPPKWKDIQNKPWLYSIALIVKEDGSTFNFPYRGGLPVRFPLVSMGPVRVKLNNNEQGKPTPYVRKV